MGPSNSSSRGKVKKFFFIFIQIMIFLHPHAFAYKIRPRWQAVLPSNLSNLAYWSIMTDNDTS